MRTVFLLAMVLSAGLRAVGEEARPRFSPSNDVISLHYDHAPDKDDGHSAAADRTLLESLYGTAWIKEHVVAVSGAYGKNAPLFDKGSDAVMDAAWNDAGGWLAAHTEREKARDELVRHWGRTLQAGGDVWVKEGGQSDLTAEVVEFLRATSPGIDTARRIHVVQHSNWNEEQTAEAALAYVKKHTDYRRIRDANAYLNVRGGDKAFQEAALKHPRWGAVWKAAFAYYPPGVRLDFSDSGELMNILGLGELGIDEFRTRFLEGKGGGVGE